MLLFKLPKLKIPVQSILWMSFHLHPSNNYGYIYQLFWLFWQLSGIAADWQALPVFKQSLCVISYNLANAVLNANNVCKVHSSSIF